MTAKTETGYMLLADISGFDAYLSDAELEHAQGVLQDLMELLIGQLTPVLLLASVHRDAVLAYAPTAQLPRGEALLDLTEATYVAFRELRTSIYRTTICRCNACLAIPTLDLKFLVHHGEYVAQQAEHGVQLGGLQVQLVRDRLLKDQVDSSNGSQAYALFTEQSLEHMNVQPNEMRKGSSTYPHIGEIRSAYIDLATRYKALTEARHAYISPDEADTILTHDIDAPPIILWDWLNDPLKRNRWMKFRTWRPGARPSGRGGIGATNHCSHGLGAIQETVLDWRPFRYFTVQFRHHTTFPMKATITYELEPLSPDQTRLHVRTRLEEGGITGSLTRPMLRGVVDRIYNFDFGKLAEIIIHDKVP
jgi:hypothetical protein